MKRKKAWLTSSVIGGSEKKNYSEMNDFFHTRMTFFSWRNYPLRISQQSSAREINVVIAKGKLHWSKYKNHSNNKKSFQKIRYKKEKRNNNSAIIIPCVHHHHLGMFTSADLIQNAQKEKKEINYLFHSS